MEVYVYADILFLINFFMDLIVLFITAKLIQVKTSAVRLLAGAFISALLYVFILFLPFKNELYKPFVSVIVITLGILAAFNPKSVKQYLKALLFTHISAIAFGGIAIALFYFTDIAYIGSFLTLSTQNFSIKLLISSTILTFILLKLSQDFIKRHIIAKQAYLKLSISFNCEKVDINALVDTGNTLTDPVDGNAVIIAEFEKIKHFLPQEFKEAVYADEQKFFEMFINDETDETLKRRLRILPFSSLGKENGLLIGFKPDSVLATYNGKEIDIENCIIGITNNGLSKDGSYHALFNPALLEGAELLCPHPL